MLNRNVQLNDVVLLLGLIGKRGPDDQCVGRVYEEPQCLDGRGGFRFACHPGLLRQQVGLRSVSASPAVTWIDSGTSAGATELVDGMAARARSLGRGRLAGIEARHSEIGVHESDKLIRLIFLKGIRQPSQPRPIIGKPLAEFQQLVAHRLSASLGRRCLQRLVYNKQPPLI